MNQGKEGKEKEEGGLNKGFVISWVEGEESKEEESLISCKELRAGEIKRDQRRSKEDEGSRRRRCRAGLCFEDERREEVNEERRRRG